MIRVALLQGQQLAEVPRYGTTPADAVRALIAGPLQSKLTQVPRLPHDWHKAAPAERRRFAGDRRLQLRLCRRSARPPSRAPRAARALLKTGRDHRVQVLSTAHPRSDWSKESR